MQIECITVYSVFVCVQLCCVAFPVQKALQITSDFDDNLTGTVLVNHCSHCMHNHDPLIRSMYTDVDNGTTVISNQSAVPSSINCSDTFFASNGVCLPRCDKWKQYQEGLSTTVDAVVLASAIARIALGTFALVASCVNRKQMYAGTTLICLFYDLNDVMT